MKEIIKNLETSAVDQRFQIIYQTILSYCLKSRKKKIESKNPKFENAKNGRITVSSRCGVCSIKKSRFIKEQEASI